MYRDDQEALLQRAESATRDAERLRQENEAMRHAVARVEQMHGNALVALPPQAAYELDVRYLPLEERARLSSHSVKRFPVWAVGVLNLLTFGLFPLIHFGMIHDRLPRAAHNDPTAGKAIGFQFIPYFNLYWVFFSSRRLADRLSLQFRLRGLPDRGPKGLLTAASVLTVIPYVNLVIGFPIMWTIAACVLQSKVNRVAELGPTTWDASLDPSMNPALNYATPPALASGYGPPAGLQAPHAFAMTHASPEQLARQASAQKMVRWSHVLGWGGLAALFVGTAAAAAVAGPAVAAVVATVAGVSTVTGAIIGQVGRGKQGRAI
jgi:hypothetical protein